MRIPLAALVLVLVLAVAITAVAIISGGGAHGGRRLVALSAIVALPTFDRAAIRWPDPVAIERELNAEWVEARAARR